MTLKNLGCFLSFFGAFFCCSASFATSFVEQPFEVTVQDAKNIVRGRIQNSDVQWVAVKDGSRRVFTYYDLLVDETLKNTDLPQQSAIRIRNLGGEKDGVGMRVMGAVQFEKGEDVIVMLGPKNPDGSFDVNGMMMGKLKVEKGDNGEELIVGPALVLHGDGGVVHGDEHDAPTKGLKKWTLQDLRNVTAKESGASPAASQAVSPRVSPSVSGVALTPSASPQPLASVESKITDDDSKQSANPQGDWLKWGGGLFLLGLVGLLLRRMMK